MSDMLWPLDEFEPHIGARTALMSTEESCSYQDLARLVEHVEHKMMARGLEPGDRVLLVGSPSIELIIALLAVLFIGLIAGLFPLQRVLSTRIIDGFRFVG